MSHLNSALYFSQKENLIKEIKKYGYLKFRDKITISPYIMVKWSLDDMVEDGILIKENITEGNFFLKKNISYIN